MSYTSDSGLEVGKVVVYQRPAYVITRRLVGHTDAVVSSDLGLVSGTQIVEGLGGCQDTRFGLCQKMMGN